DALGPEQDDDDQGDGVHQHGIGEHVLDNGRQRRHPGAVLDGVVQQEHHHGGDHRAGEGAHAAHHHHYHNEHGVQDGAVGEGEGGGGQSPVAAGVQGTGDPREEGGDGE